MNLSADARRAGFVPSKCLANGFGLEDTRLSFGARPRRDDAHGDAGDPDADVPMPMPSSRDLPVLTFRWVRKLREVSAWHFDCTYKDCMSCNGSPTSAKNRRSKLRRPCYDEEGGIVRILIRL